MPVSEPDSVDTHGLTGDAAEVVRLRAECKRHADNHDQVVRWLREKEAEAERLRAERGTLLGIAANIRDEAMDAHELDAQSAPTGDEIQRIIDYAERAIALIDLNAS